MTVNTITPATLYTTQEVAALKIATKDTLARWRMENVGIPFIKSGSKVLYRGQDILDWLESNRVETSS